MVRSGNKRITNERRITDQRRLNGDRRVVDEGAPERRWGFERRKKELGPPERRARQERRGNEVGPPPGWRERRRWAERRSPDVTESSFEEWVRLRVIRRATASEREVPKEDDDDKLGGLIIRD